MPTDVPEDDLPSNLGSPASSSNAVPADDLPSMGEASQKVTGGGSQPFSQRFLGRAFERTPGIMAVPFQANVAKGAIAGAATQLGLQGAGMALSAIAPEAAVPVFLARALKTGEGLGGIAASIAQGASGGAAMGATESLGQQLGLSPAQKMAAETLAGVAGSSLVANLPKLGEAAMDIAVHPRYAIRKLFEGKSSTEKLQEATKLQKNMFGKADPNFDPTRIGTQATDNLKLNYAMQDPSYAAAAKQNPSLKPDDYYRGKLFTDVSALMQSGNLFSRSPEYNALERKIMTLRDARKLSNADAQDILSRLSVDQSLNPEARAMYPEVIHDTVRQWQAPLNPQGAKMIDARTEQSVKKSLQEAYNQWLDKAGLGQAETNLKKVEQQQIFAQARDRAQTLVSRYVPNNLKIDDELSKLARDPEAKPIVLGAVKNHLANIPTDEVPKEFNRLDTMLVKSGVMGFKEVEGLRQQAKKIELAIQNGVDYSTTQRMAKAFAKNLASALTVQSSIPLASDEPANP